MKNVVITGSTRGIGYAMALEFLKAGCHVTISGRGMKISDQLAQKLALYSKQVEYISCDVKDKDSLQHLWDESVKRWGSVDIWINNAGINTPHVFVDETPKVDIDAVLDTNLKGLIFGTQIAINGMRTQGHGAIYSMEGLGSNNMIQVKTILYGTTKHALTYFMKGVAKELDGSKFLTGRLSPGMMLTDFITKTSDGQEASVIHNPDFRKIFNILADRPETVAPFLVKGMLDNTKNDAHIVWLTPIKTIKRFMSAPFSKRQLI